MKWLKRILPVIGTVSLLLFLLRQVHITEILALIAHARLAWLVLGLLVYMATNLIRAYRTAILLDKHSPRAVLALLPDMYLLSLFNNTLPSRSGELSFPYLMWHRHQVTLGESAAILVLMRVLDYVAVAALFLAAAALTTYRLAPAALRVVGFTFAFLLVSGSCLAAMPWLGDRALAAIERLLEKLGLAGRRPVAWLLGAGSRGVSALERMRSPRLALLASLASILGWLGTFSWFAAFMQAVGHPQSLLMVIVGATFATLAKAIPLISVGGLGAHEAGWTLGFGLVGVPPADAIASGFAVNVLTLCASVICGAGAFLILAFARRWAHPSATAVLPAAPLTASGSTSIPEQ